VCDGSRGARGCWTGPRAKRTPAAVAPAGPLGSPTAWTSSRTRWRGRGAMGMPTWCWEAGDVVGRRLAVVQLVETGARPGPRSQRASGSPTRRRGAGPVLREQAPRRSLQVKGPKRASKLTRRKGRRSGRPGRAALDGRVAEACGGEPQFRVPGVAGRRLVACPQRRDAKVRGQGTGAAGRPEPRPAERQAARPGCWPGGTGVLRRCSLPLAGHCWSCRRWSPEG